MSRSGTSANNGRLDVRKTYKMLIGGAFVRSESGRALMWRRQVANGWGMCVVLREKIFGML